MKIVAASTLNPPTPEIDNMWTSSKVCIKMEAVQDPLQAGPRKCPISNIPLPSLQLILLKLSGFVRKIPPTRIWIMIIMTPTSRLPKAIKILSEPYCWLFAFVCFLVKHIVETKDNFFRHVTPMSVKLQTPLFWENMICTP